MDKYLEMRVFATVVDTGSFVGASDALDLSRQAISRIVGELEQRLNTRLLTRTTRKLSLTGEGEIFYANCMDILQRIEDAEAELSSRTAEPHGVLRINAPMSFGLLHLAALWSQFIPLHPKLTLDVTLGDRVVDLVEEGFDLAIRIGRLQSSSLISRLLASTRVILCASPEYLRLRGTPAHPAELAQHTVLAYSLLATGDNWQFTGPDGPISVRVAPAIRTNSGDTCRTAALQHAGLVLQPSFLVGEDLRRGTLVEVMPAYRSIELGIYAVYPSRKHVPPKVRAMVDFLTRAFVKSPWPE